MSENPFASGSATFDAGAGRPQMMTGELDVGLTLSQAWKATWDNFPLWLGVLIVGGIINAVAQVTVIGYVFISPVITWGNVLFTLNMIDGRASFNDLFAGFSKFGQALGSMLGFFILMALAGAVGFSVSVVGAALNSSVLAALGMVVAAVWMMAIFLRLMFSPFFIVDQGMGAIEAMKASWALTSRQKLNVFLLMLLSGVVGVAGVVACFVGVLASMTIAYAMWASAYRQLTGTSARR